MVPARYAQVNIRNLSEFAFEQYLRNPDHIDVSYDFSHYITQANILSNEKREILILCRSFLVELCRQVSYSYHHRGLGTKVNVIFVIDSTKIAFVGGCA